MLLLTVAIVFFVIGALYGRFVVPYLVDRRHAVLATTLPSVLSIIALVLTQ